MSLISLAVQDFRCFSRAELHFDARCTLITGGNGAGKTSLLEAVQFLSSGRSFRSARSETLIRATMPELLLTARVQQQRLHTLGLRWSPNGREMRLDAEPASRMAQFAAVLPTQVIDPSSHELIQGPPSERRRFLDWGVFHVEPQFLPTWRRYQRSLRQRNAALKAQQPQELVRLWDADLAEAGEVLAVQRARYVDRLRIALYPIAHLFLGTAVEMALRQGWREGSLAESLDAALQPDLRYKTTTVGPHRADLVLRVQDCAARDRISRGQQKLLACALVLAQLTSHVNAGLPMPTLLLDDPAAELDVNNLGKLLQLLSSLPIQIVVAALDGVSVASIQPAKQFHVEQGQVVEVV